MEIQMSVSKLMRCLPSLILHSFTVCAQCTIPQHEEVWHYCRVRLCGSFRVKLWHSLVVGCGSPPYRIRMGSWQTTWGFVPVIITYLMHLLTPPRLPAAVESHSTPPSVCCREVHLPNPTVIYSGRFNITL